MALPLKSRPFKAFIFWRFFSRVFFVHMSFPDFSLKLIRNATYYLLTYTRLRNKLKYQSTMSKQAFCPSLYSWSACMSACKLQAEICLHIVCLDWSDEMKTNLSLQVASWLEYEDGQNACLQLVLFCKRSWYLGNFLNLGCLY